MIQDLLDTYRTKSNKKSNNFGGGDDDNDSDDAVTVDEVCTVNQFRLHKYIQICLICVHSISFVETP